MPAKPQKPFYRHAHRMSIMAIGVTVMLGVSLSVAFPPPGGEQQQVPTTYDDFLLDGTQPNTSDFGKIKLWISKKLWI